MARLSGFMVRGSRVGSKPRLRLGLLLMAASCLAWLSGVAFANPPETELEPPAASAAMSTEPAPVDDQTGLVPPAGDADREPAALRIASDGTLPLFGAVAAMAGVILLLRWVRLRRDPTS